MTEIERELAWAEWAYAFVSLLGSAVPIVEPLELLAAETASPELQQASRQMLDGILTGHTLLTAAREWPEPLPGLGLAYLRVGEVAGILDETPLAWAEALRGRVEQRFRYGPAAVTPELERQRAENTLLRLLGMCLSSGVPLDVAWEAIGLVFTGWPERAAQLQDALHAAGTEEVAPVLEALGASPLACRIARHGGTFGHLDRSLLRAADLLDYQLALRLLPAS